MKILVVLLLGLVGTQAKPTVTPYSYEDTFKSISADIDGLTADIVGFSKQFEAGGVQANRVDATLQSLFGHVESLEGSGCDERIAFQCGGTSPSCVSRLLVCDGVEDCANGKDESQCRALTPTGSRWQADVIYDDCSTLQPDSFEVDIESYTVIDYIKPYPVVKAQLIYEKTSGRNHQHVSLPLDGWMDLKPGNHILYFPPPEGDGIAFACVFDGIDDSHCHGQFLHESSQEECASFFVHRID